MAVRCMNLFESLVSLTSLLISLHILLGIKVGMKGCHFMVPFIWVFYAMAIFAATFAATDFTRLYTGSSSMIGNG